MSTERDELANVIAETYLNNMAAGPLAPKLTNTDLAEDILAAGYRKPQQVTTEADLVALPARSVILLDDGNAIQKDGHYWFEASSYDMPMTALYIWENDFLPATVLHEPEATE